MARWEEELLAYGNQDHVISQLRINPSLATQLDSANDSYPGGLKAYIARAKRLLDDSRQSVNPYAGFQIRSPPTVNLSIGDEKFIAYERTGLKAAGKLGFILVAGGLGERLGYPDIKINLPTNIVTGTTYCEYYFSTIRACQALVSDSCKLPIMIMTSDDTHERTVELLEHHRYFGLDQTQVYILKQDKVPAVIDNNAKLALDPVHGDLLTKPHGHGDVHTLIHKNKLMDKWNSSYDTEYLFFFQDTNALSFRALFAMLGVTIQHGYDMNSLAVLRTPGEAVGAICTLDNGNIHYTVNIEYNLLDSLLPNGDKPVSAEHPYSALPGNCNILMFHVPPYKAALEKTEGLVPEFVNPKYKDPKTKTDFKSPTRLEGMMQDFAKCMPDPDKIVATTMDRWFCFSCVKNNAKDAGAKYKSGLPAECASSAEAEFYYNNIKCLTMALPKQATFGIEDNCSLVECLSKTTDLPTDVQVSYNTVTVPMNLPKIVMSPFFAICLSQMIDRTANVTKLTLSKLSTLVLNSAVEFESLEIYDDSALVLPQEPSPNSKLVISGTISLRHGIQYQFTPEILPTDSLVSQMRGYKIVRC